MRIAIATCLSALVLAAPAHADESELSELRRRVAQLEDRVRAAEDRGALPAPAVDARPEPAEQRWRLSGNAEVIQWGGGSDSFAADGGTSLEDFELFFDFDLGWRPRLGGARLAESASLHVEWDVIRHGYLQNRIGSLYVEFAELGGSSAFNLRLGRMEIPFGEEYSRFSRDRAENPLLSYSAAAPYNWDTGVMLHGTLAEGRLGYQVAVLNGDDGLNANTSGDPSWVAKLSAAPLPWTRISLSGFRSGGLGNGSRAAESALEWGGTHAVPFGSGTGVTSFQDGLPIADDPESLRLDGVEAWEADLILSPPGWGRLWLAHGRVGIDSGSSSGYDRELRYWIAEGRLDLGALAALLEPLYVAVRYSSLGSGNRDEGYLLPAMNAGGDLGFNTARAELWSAGLGLRLQPGLTLKAEYSWSQFELVRGAGALERQIDDKDYLGLGLSVHF